MGVCPKMIAGYTSRSHSHHYLLESLPQIQNLDRTLQTW